MSPFNHNSLRVSIPIYSSRHFLKGFSTRAIQEGGALKYVNTKGLEKDELFNIENTKEHKNLIIVEGYFDVLKARSGTIENVAALDSSGFKYYVIDITAKFPQINLDQLSCQFARQDRSLSQLLEEQPVHCQNTNSD